MSKEDTKTLTLRLPDNTRRQVKVAAAEQDQSINAWIIEAIKEKLKRENT